MTKSELSKELAQEVEGLTQKKAAEIVDALFSPDGGIIAKSTRGGNGLNIPGFGKFEARSRAAREARNPRTGETIQVKAQKAVVFSVGKTFKDYVN